MSTPDLSPRNDAVLHIPGNLLSQIENLAENEHTDAASIVEQALRSLRADQFVRDVERLRADAPPTSYTEEDIPRLIREVREEDRRAGRS